MERPDIRSVRVIRYIKPLREGGSLPAIVDADDGFPYVIKFRGAGQGKKALIAELLGGELARALGLKVPELVFMDLADGFSRLEPDEEIQDILKFSIGLNLGLHYLSGAITYDPIVSVADALTASKVVLLDGIITNIDRTHRNTNLLNWNRELWLIDHGASFYFHHNWARWETFLDRTFPAIKDHCLLDRASELEEAADQIASSLTPEVIHQIVSIIPDDWLEDETSEWGPQERRERYEKFLNARIGNIESLKIEAQNVRKERV